MQYWSCNKCKNNMSTKNYKNMEPFNDNYVLIYRCDKCNQQNCLETKNAIEIHGAKVMKVFDKDVYNNQQIINELTRLKLSL